MGTYKSPVISPANLLKSPSRMSAWSHCPVRPTVAYPSDRACLGGDLAGERNCPSEPVRFLRPGHPWPGHRSGTLTVRSGFTNTVLLRMMWRFVVPLKRALT